MKILLSVPGFFPYGYGGGQVYVLGLAGELQLLGHEVSIVTSAPWEGGGGAARRGEYTYQGLSVTGISLNPAHLSAADLYTESAPGLHEGLLAVLRARNPDIVHASGIKAATLSAALEMMIPAVVTAHHPGFVCPNGTLLTPKDLICRVPMSTASCVPCCCRSKRPGAVGRWLGRLPASAYRCLGGALDRFRGVPYLGRGLMYPWLVERRVRMLRVLLTGYRRIIAPSAAIRTAILLTGVAPEKLSLVPHGSDLQGKRQAVDRPQSALRLGYLGRIDRAKGFHLLTRALELIPGGGRVELHIFGGAQNSWDERYFRQCLADYRGQARIVAKGVVERGRLAEAFDEIDILVLPSLSLEVFGLVVLEAFSHGKPVITTRCGGPEALVRDGVDGCVVARNDPAALAVAVRRFLDEPDLLQRMSSRIGPVRTMREHAVDVFGVYKEALRGG